MQPLLISPLTPITAGFIFLLVAGYFELKTYQVPNLLTVSALAIAIVFSFVAPILAPERSGGIGPALMGMILGGLILLPGYIKGGLGAGCVKAQAAFGAWVGAGTDYGQCLSMMGIATVAAAIFATGAWFATCQQRKVAALEPGKFLRIMHGQLPLSVGTMLGVVLATLINQ